MSSSESDRWRDERVDTIAEIPLDANPDVDQLLADLTLDTWLEGAREDYVLLRLSSTLAGHGDPDLATRVQAIDTPGQWLEFLERLDDWRHRCRGIIDLCDCAEARLLIVLDRKRRRHDNSNGARKSG